MRYLSFISVLALAVGSMAPMAPAIGDSCSRFVANTDAVVDVCAGGVRAVSQPSQDDPGVEDLFSFPSATSTVVGSVGFINADEVGFFWSAARGDRVSENFSTGLASVNRAILDVEVVTNVLTSVGVDWELVINGVVVGSLTVPVGFTGPVTLDVSFAPIAGPNYNVMFRVTNEIAPGAGSHTLAYAGGFAHSVELLGGGGQVGADLINQTAGFVFCRNQATGDSDFQFGVGASYVCNFPTSPGDPVLQIFRGTAQ